MVRAIEKSLEISNKIITIDNILDLLDALKIENQKEENERIPLNEDILSAETRIKEIDKAIEQLQTQSGSLSPQEYKEKYNLLDAESDEQYYKKRSTEKEILYHTPNNTAEIVTSNETITLDNYEDAIRILRNEKINKIRLSFSLSRIKKLNIKLENAKKKTYPASYISISGTDEEWVRSTYDLLKNKIGFWQNQFDFNKYRPFTYLGLFIIPILIIALLITENVKIDNSYGAILLGLTMVTLITPSYIIDKISELFPFIELQTGPKNLHIEEGKRNKIFIIILSIIIPIIIAAVFFILSLRS
jgi:hypothetical protein